MIKRFIRSRKGVDVWIWVLLGLIAGSFLIATVLTIFRESESGRSKEIALTNLEDLAYKINTLCWSMQFTSTSAKVTITEPVVAIYIADNPENKTIPLTNNTGQFLCLRFRDENFARCSKLRCYATMDTIYYNETIKSKALKILGRAPKVEKILVLKRRSNDVLVKVEQR